MCVLTPINEFKGPTLCVFCPYLKYHPLLSYLKYQKVADLQTSACDGRHNHDGPELGDDSNWTYVTAGWTYVTVTQLGDDSNWTYVTAGR